MKIILAFLMLLTINNTIAKEDDLKYNELTHEEKQVIEKRATEPPFSGKYNDHYQAGTYLCLRCGAPLYESISKFDSGSGWPSFDDEISGAIKRIPDADGRRVEIVCANCNAHLGHVFEGEKYTEKNIRHCVNSRSLTFVPAPQTASAYVAGGCFWGVEHYLQQDEGVISATSGYMGGNVENPDYHQVCLGTTGHAETVKVLYDPGKTSYEAILRRFFEIHDPTQYNHQGPDYGNQYRSAIFFSNQEEMKTAQKLIDLLKAKGFDVVTELKPALKFWQAENYHQDYYEKSGGAPYCHRPVNRFD
jgi:peptide methionine sulfoxide reductase msrA/msrB